MKLSLQSLLGGLVTLILLGSQTNSPAAGSRELKEIRIESRPQGWGYAHKTVKSDGSIAGAHLSGGAGAPRVFESRSQITPQDMSTLRALVMAIGAERAGEEGRAPDQKVEGFRSITITFGDGKSATAYAGWDARFGSDAFQTIWEIISKYKVGAW